MLPKDRDYEQKKIYRIVFILNKLNGGGKVQTRALAEELNVDMRSIQRDLMLIDRVGFPLMCPDKGVYSFMEGFSLKKATMTSEDASLLAFLYDITRSLGKKFEGSFNNILQKVLYSESDSAYFAKMPEGVKLNKNTPFITEIEEAITDTSRIEFDYLKGGKEKRLKVDPLKIAFFDGFWYLICRVSGKDWILKLRLENIRKLEVLEEYFSVPKNMKTMLDQSASIWFPEKRDKKLVVEINKDAARFFKQRDYFPLQKITKENKDGSLIIESKVGHYMEVIPVILRWIPYVKIISPTELRDEVAERIKSYMSLK